MLESEFIPQQNSREGGRSVDAIIVGAGFAGLYMLHRLRSLGFRAIVLEAADSVGGVWYWNRYPGARCDVESMQYSYSFSEELQQEWGWNERYATGPEILRYLNHVADRFALRPHIRLETKVASAKFDEQTAHWTVKTDQGEVIEAQFCIMATGGLSAAKQPDIPGYGSFAGVTLHTSDWPHEPVDLAGKRVAVIGTGSSGVQAIPVIAETAGELVVFQRTANFSVPARNQPMTPDYAQSWKTDYAERRRQARHRPSGTLYEVGTRSAMDVPHEERVRDYEARWLLGGTGFTRTYNDIARHKPSNETAAEFIREKIRTTVTDPATRETLTPRSFAVGAKRICIDSGYYETFNRPNVKLVDLRKTPISEITAHGIQTSERFYDFDVIVFATGFDALTGALARIDIVGRDGTSLREYWSAGPRTYLGLMAAKFPNLFIVAGPGSPSVLSNVVVSIEQHVDWISDCLVWLREQDAQSIEAAPTAESDWVEHVNEEAAKTLFFEASSWYLGANVPGKPRIFMPYPGGVGAYRNKCDEVASSRYSGFLVTRANGEVCQSEETPPGSC